MARTLGGKRGRSAARKTPSRSGRPAATTPRKPASGKKDARELQDMLAVALAQGDGPPSVTRAEPIPDAARAEIDALLASGDLFRYETAGESAVSRLEREFAEFLGVPYALAVNSCSSALFLALRALDIGPGDEVLIPAFTFAAVPSAVIHAGARPVLVEIGDNYRLDMADFEARLGPRVKAAMVSHMRGQTSDMDAIMRLCDASGIPVIEDAAHSLGTTWDGSKIGAIGTIGCFSFQSFKMMNAGEGGMLVTSDPDTIARAVILSGAYEHYWAKHPVAQERFHFWQNRLPLYNMRMNNLSAVVVRAQIGEVARRVRCGRKNHDALAEILNKSFFLSVPPALAKERRAPDSIQFNLLGFDSDDEARAFQEAARARGVPVQIIGLAEDNARAFWNWEFLPPQKGLERTRAILMRACDLRLPVWLSKRDIDFIAAALLAAVDDVMGKPKSG